MKRTRETGSKRGPRLAALLVATAMLAGIVPLYAQDAAESDSAKPDLANWWLRNAFSCGPLPEGWLFHAELDYSFNFKTGNVDGVMHQGKTAIYLRKGYVTLGTKGLISTQRLSIASGTASVSTEQYQVAPTLDVAVTRGFGPELGVYWEKNSAAFIEQRSIGYLGLNVNPLGGPALIFSVMPAFGYLHEEALLTGEIQWFWASYLEEKATWKVSDRLTLHHDANALISVEGADDYRLGMSNTLEFPVTSALSLTINHQIRYNNNPVPTQAAIDSLTGGSGKVYKTDNDLMIGVRIQH